MVQFAGPGTPQRPSLRANRYVVGADAELYLASGPLAGEFLLHMSTWRCRGNIHSDTEQPPGHKLVQHVRTGYEFTLELTESVIRAGDPYLLKQVMQDIYADQSVPMSFMGKIGGRSVQVNGRATTISTVTIEDCEVIGQFDVAGVQGGGIQRRTFNFGCNSVPWFDDFLELGAAA